MKSVKIDIKNNSTYESLSQEMSLLAALTIKDCLYLIENKKEIFVDQDDNKATYANKIDKIEGKIDWNEKASKILAKIHGLYPEPGCWFNLHGSRIKILEAKEIHYQGKPGEVINGEFVIGCLENSIQILQLKKEGKNSMKASDFLIGNKLNIGENLNEA